MKKYLISIGLCLAVVMAPALQAQVPPAVGSYLGTIKGSDWAIMGQAALGITPSDTAFLKTIDGATANDYATYILALTSLGKDPRYFGSENLVESLRQKASSGQLGDVALLNDDMFGLLALVSAGVSTGDSLVASEAAYIKSKQLPDGSWDFATAATVGSADMTAMGIMALRAAGVAASDTALTKAANYLLSGQNNDGGWPMLAGQASNTESTAWVLSAVYALGEQPSFWSKNNVTAIDYLSARLQPSGYAAFDSNATGTTGRTPVTTSYAAIALSGKYYPIQTLSAPVNVSLRVEGKEATICETQTQGRTALDAAQSAAGICNYTYHIQDTQYGPYLDIINTEAAAGFVGWLFLINNQPLQVGAGDYLVKTNDVILLYYGNWDDLPLRLTSSASSVSLNGSTTATAEKYDYNQQIWLAVPNITVKRGSESFTTDAAGKATLAWPQAGSYQIWASGANLIRSAKVFVIAGDGSSQQQSLGLEVTITNPAGNPAGGQNQPNNQNSAVVFGVSGDLNFGTLTPGQTANKTATLTNSGTTNITTTASVSGSAVFTKYLTLDSLAVPSWQKRLDKGAQSPVNVGLSIPSNYTGTGKEQGTLIFWANIIVE